MGQADLWSDATTLRPSSATRTIGPASPSGCAASPTPEAGWASAHSVPHALTLDGDTLIATPHPDLEQYRTGATTGDVAGLAADVTWTPDEAGLSIESGGQALVSLTRENDAVVTVGVGANEWQLPYSGKVRIILEVPCWRSPAPVVCSAARYPRKAPP